jgi:hypothetical protein
LAKFRSLELPIGGWLAEDVNYWYVGEFLPFNATHKSWIA